MHKNWVYQFDLIIVILGVGLSVTQLYGKIVISFFQHNKKIYQNFYSTSFSGRFFRFRRNNPRFVLSFSNYIISLWLIVFALKIGSLLFFVLTDIGEPQKAYALHGINLPLSSSADKIHNKRLISYLSINSNGNIIFDGIKTDKSNLIKLLSQRKMDLPSVIICMVASDDCKMELVLDVLELLKKADTRNVFFLTRYAQVINPI